MIQRTFERLDIAARQAWTRKFQYADLEPRDLPPSAVLFVRRLPDPLPRRAFASLDDQSPSAEWEAGVRSALSDCYWRTVARGYAAQSPGASAVAFADEAEMLAALSIDLAAGEARRRWHWRPVIRGLPAAPAEAISALWLRRPELGPAILERLAVLGAHSAVLALLTGVQAARLIVSIAEAFELPALAAIASEFLRQSPHPGPAAADRPSPAAAPPWSTVLSAFAPLPESLSPAHRLLAALALTLRRAPAAVSTPAFAEAAAICLSPAAAPPPAAPPPAAAPPAPATQPPDAAPSPAVESEPAVARFLDTELGGALFLINLARGLDLWRALDREFGIASELSPWALLELLARILLGRREPRRLSDPLWKFFAEMDGRAPADPVAPAFRGAAGYALPAAWTALAPPPPALLAKFRAGRVQLWDPAGFVVADLPAHRWKAFAAGRPVARRRGRTPPSDPVSCVCSPPLRRFLAFLAPYIRWRLEAWLGPALARALLARRGRLYITPTHLDLVLPLDAATAPVRAAGLDANPGWTPQLGRIVTFHYR